MAWEVVWCEGIFYLVLKIQRIACYCGINLTLTLSTWQWKILDDFSLSIDFGPKIILRFPDNSSLLAQNPYPLCDRWKFNKYFCLFKTQQISRHILSKSDTPKQNLLFQSITLDIVLKPLNVERKMTTKDLVFPPVSIIQNIYSFLSFRFSALTYLYLQKKSFSMFFFQQVFKHTLVIMSC